MNGHHRGCAFGEEQICLCLAWCSAWLPASHPCQLDQWMCCHFLVIKSFLHIHICTIRGFYWVFCFLLEPAVSTQRHRRHRADRTA